MKITWNKKTNLPVIEFEEQDYANANLVREMLVSPAWQILCGYFESMRLSMEERGKSHARGRATKDLCSNDFSVLDGFDVAIGIPQKIVLQADMMREQQNPTKEAENAGRESDEY